jgi:hypothetical protein
MVGGSCDPHGSLLRQPKSYEKYMIGHYSIIQFVPDPNRKEGSNVGVLLFVPDYAPGISFVKLLMTDTNEGPRRMFGDIAFDAERLTRYKKSFANAVESEKGFWKTLKDLQHFIGTWGNSLQMLGPFVVLVEDPEADCAALFRSLVLPNPDRVYGNH